MKKPALTALTLAVVALAGLPVYAGVDAALVFDQLKSLEGTWTGTPEGKGEEAEAEAQAMPDAVHQFEVSAGGTVLMETMAPGSDHEMINMYHLDGEDLLLTHYCSGGNQPRMRLDRTASTANDLVFAFDGGTNLDAADHHIHSARIRMHEDGGLDSIWFAQSGGEAAGEMAFRLTRAEAEN